MNFFLMLLADVKKLIFMDYSKTLMNKEEEEGKRGAKRKRKPGRRKRNKNIESIKKCRKKARFG